MVVQPLLIPPRGSRQHSSTAVWNGSSPTLQLELPTNSMNYPNIYLKKEGWGKEQVQKIKKEKQQQELSTFPKNKAELH